MVFATKTGQPISLANFYNRAWKPIQLASEGLSEIVKDEMGKPKRDASGKPVLEPRYNFHLLRHFHASMLIADEANPKEVQVEMGILAFRSPTTCMDTCLPMTRPTSGARTVGTASR